MSLKSHSGICFMMALNWALGLHWDWELMEWICIEARFTFEFSMERGA